MKIIKGHKTIQKIIGLSLMSPLSAFALSLEGTQTFNEFVNVPVTHNPEPHAGIEILNGSKTTFEQGVSINVQGDDKQGISQYYPTNYSKTVFNGDLSIYLKSDTSSSSSAIFMASKYSNIIVNGYASIVTECETSCRDNDGFDGQLDAIDMIGGNLELNGGAIIQGDINVQSEGQLTINNKATILGDIDAYDDGKVTLNLAKGSVFIGHAHSDKDANDIDAKAGVINLNMEQGSVWHLEGATSYITSLSGQGAINFNTNIDDYKNLSIENLSGTSIFSMRSDIAALKSDKIIIVNNAEGNHTLNVTNNARALTTGDEKVTLVEVNNGATNSATFKLGNAVELGGYNYTLNQDGNNLVLATNKSATGPEITTTANASANFLNTSYLMSYVETQTLLQRLGNMRRSGENGDLWMRGFAGKVNSFANGKLSHFDMNYHGFQLGADKQLSETTPLVVGAFVGQTYGDPDYRSGDGSLTSFNTGLYASYLDNNGFYIDGVAKYLRQKNHFKVRDTANERVQGTGHTNGFGLSVEVGQKYDINHFYIEPQVQLTYNRQDSTTVHATNGLNVKLGDYNSLIGRASALFGYEVSANENPINLYLKTGIVREFDGDTYYKLNGSKESYSFKGNWWNNGVGINAQLHKNHTLYVEFDSNLGHNFDQLQANGGYRYSF